MMRFVDLFCGIGSFHAAFRGKGAECVLACDSDEAVRKTYARMYPGTRVEGDVCDVEDVPQHDVLCAGFPCQPFSNIGFRRGGREERGTLIDQVARFARLGNPKYILLENVRGLLSSNGGEDFRRVVALFEGLGYHVRWRVLKAVDYGIPQLRQRLFIVANRGERPFDMALLDARRTPSPPLADYLGRPVRRTTAFTVRVGGRRSGLASRHNWDTYQMEDGSVHTLDVGDCTRLQGFDPIPWPDNVKEKDRMKMLGNGIPTCLTRAVVDAVMQSMER